MEENTEAPGITLLDMLFKDLRDELRVRLALRNWFKRSSKIFYWRFQGGTSFVDHLCYLCPVFVMFSRLFIAAVWSPVGKELTAWLLFVRFNCVLSLSHVVSWVRCGT